MPSNSQPHRQGGVEPRQVPLIAIERELDPLREEIIAGLTRVCETGAFVLGPEVDRLENAIAEYCGAKHAIGCASGSDALLLALMALEIGPSDEVLLPSYTFFATASAVSRLGATPVFVDIEPQGYNLDVADLAKKITPATRAIIPVHLYGQCADMEAIDTIAAEHKLAVVEDAAQAIGAEFAGKRAGTIGHIGCFSFYPTKNLGGCGDGGMLTTDDDALAARLKLLRVHGMQPRYHHQVVGINSRLDAFQAAALCVKLPHLDAWTEARQANAARYHKLFQQAGLADHLTLPCELPSRRHVWNQYIIRVTNGRRDALRQHLAAAGVGSEIYYPIPLHQQQCFADLGYAPGSLPITEAAAAETIALPIFPQLMADEQAYVVQCIGEYFAGRQTAAA